MVAGADSIAPGLGSPHLDAAFLLFVCAHRTCRSRIRHQAAAGSWTMPRQWEIQRTWLNSARAAVRSPAKPNGV